jgi:integrase
MKKRKYPVTDFEGQKIRQLGPNSFMADFNFNGRQRRCFGSLPEAKDFILEKKTEVKNKGRSAFALADTDRADLAKFREADPVTRLFDVFAFWQIHHPAGQAVTVEALVDEFLSAKGRRGKKIVERREATTTGHEKRLRTFIENFGGKFAHDVTVNDIEDWLSARSGGELNKRHYLASVRALFNHGLRRGAVGSNPAEAVEMPEAATAAPRIMAVVEVEKYLAAIAKAAPELLAREALAFFCGLRPEELTRLDWRNVSLENRLVTIEGDVAKVQGHRRHVEIPDNLAAWLAPLARVTGPVWPYASPTTLHLKREAARKECKKVTVPDNAGRHAFASYHLALHENAPKTAEAMGHADVDLLKNVYRNITAADGRPITKATAEAYFKIIPKQDAKIIPLRAAG